MRLQHRIYKDQENRDGGRGARREIRRGGMKEEEERMREPTPEHDSVMHWFGTNL